jgi:hypothetical protein
MIACDLKYLHEPPAPDRSKWPYDTPIIEIELKRRLLTVAHAASLQSFEIFDNVGERWMHRALRAEGHLRDAVKASQDILSRMRELELKLRERM